MTDWKLPGDRINDIQQSSIEQLVRRCKQAHFVNVRVRINGKFEDWEADWIKHLTPDSADVEQSLAESAAGAARCPHGVWLGDHCYQCAAETVAPASATEPCKWCGRPVTEQTEAPADYCVHDGLAFDVTTPTVDLATELQAKGFPQKPVGSR